MSRLIPALLLAAGLGCTSIQPAGPLAGRLGVPPAGKDFDDLPPPVKVPTPKPTPPANLVDPAEVASGDPYAAAKKLMAEYEADRKTMPKAPVTAEVSHIPGRLK
jgi:hypothetical protein